MFDLAAVAVGDGFTPGLLAAALVLGLRHGVDWDHIAAISDITATTPGRQGLRLGMTYAVGHGAVVLVLGLVAIELGSRLPPSVDAVMGRVAGGTLLVLGLVVAVSLVQERGRFRMRSRWLLVIVRARELARAVHRRLAPEHRSIEHTHDHVAVDGFHHDGDGAPDTGAGDDWGRAGDRLRAPVHGHRHRHDHGLDEYTGKLSFGVGMLHGVGAETPTQVVVFVAAAQAGGTISGAAVLVVFLTGLLASNAAITLVGVAGFGATTVQPRWHLIMAVLTTVVSLVVGAALIAGTEQILPPLFAA